MGVWKFHVLKSYFNNYSEELILVTDSNGIFFSPFVPQLQLDVKFDNIDIVEFWNKNIVSEKVVVNILTKFIDSRAPGCVMWIW